MASATRTPMGLNETHLLELKTELEKDEKAIYRIKNITQDKCVKPDKPQKYSAADETRLIDDSILDYQ